MARRAEGRVERLTLGTEPAPPVIAGVATAASRPVASSTAFHPADTAAVRDIVRDAIERTTPFRIVGRGTWLDAGRPVADLPRVSLDGLTGIVDYTPGDLTLTARAGTSLAEIAAATLPNGQWLALAPCGGDDGSLGAVAATASAGPLSGAFGTPRDMVIGLEAVTGAGDVIRGGGRVVKNVAGFDLTRLMVGAWGTLGVLTEISVRLRGLPEHDATIALPLPATPAQLTHLLTRLRAASVAPLALELVGAALATRLGLEPRPLLIARFAGNGENVAAQREAFSQFGDIADVDNAVWNTLRVAEPPTASVVRLSGSVARFSETWATAERVAALAPDGFAHATVLRSVARVVIPDDDGGMPVAAADALAALTRDVRVFERLPAAVWQSLAPAAVDDRISAGIRRTFDPHRLLNPGILGES